MEVNWREKFHNLGLPINEYVFNYSDDIKTKIYNYLAQLKEEQLQTYLIAYNHLGSSFNILLSNGFKEFYSS